jgi:hypothetical protein
MATPILVSGMAGQLAIERPPGAITSSTPTGDVAALSDGRFLWVLANEDASIWSGRAAHDGSADPTSGEDNSGRVTLTDCTRFSTTRLVADADGGAVVPIRPAVDRSATTTSCMRWPMRKTPR